MNNRNKVSVIIPVFNAEDYIIETLNSVTNQTFDEKYEVILINDGSEDNSINLINEFIDNNENERISFEVYNDGKNEGQGARRNQGIELATGDAILFLDSDDLIVNTTLEMAYTKLMSTKENDFVIFEWAYYYPETGESKYVNKERYSRMRVLYRDKCEMLLSCSTYFSVNKLYKRSFLNRHKIRFGEGYIYEDFEFYVSCALKAYRAPVISNILYKVRVHNKSTTKTDHESTKHRDSFLKAISSAASKLQEGYRDKYTPYQVCKYFLYRSLLYSEKRLPADKNMRDEFIKSTMMIINKYCPNILVPNGVLPLYNYAFSKGIVKKLEIKKMKKLYKLHKNNRINFYYSRDIEKTNKKNKVKNKVKNNYYLKPLIYNLRRQVHANRNKKRKKELARYNSLQIKPGTIIMLGFDYKYRGNSKYLFEFLKDRYSSDKLKFITYDNRVPDEYRITPRTVDFFNCFYTSNYVIAESWIPAGFKKKSGQKWIQLWHGTPFKKMLFDSNEMTMLGLNPNHKVKMKNDISRWDYLIADSEIGKEKFISSFDITNEKIITSGYPRNRWLIDNQNNHELIRSIKIQNNIPLDKKIILYAPTWRDYNYKVVENKKDLHYMMQFRTLLDHLGSDYCIINKAHSMDIQPTWNTGITQVFTVNESVETQELLLISDLIITDYSSIYFDAIHINKPFYFLIKDYSKFDLARGIYLDMYNDILKLVAKNEVELAKKIKSNEFKDFVVPENYKNKDLNMADEQIQNLMN